jgi:arylformamidase
MPHLTRRTLLAGAAVMAGDAALAQGAPPAPPARAKGPAVWLDLDQKELDDAYASYSWVAVGATWATAP